ncbi:MAG: precorrin-6A reductase, partial [Candidatus Methanomethylophilaceae archaeon]|nr:precorrin-6A reductase [Candidatus Methanomethylophilaceae archaeon]
MDRVLIFGGTTEGMEIADWLAANGVDVSVRVATEYGSTRYSDKVDVQLGSCGGAEGIADHIRKNGYNLVIDCTHPYAVTISEHVKEGCESAGTELIRVKRKDSADTAGTVCVGSLDEAVDYLIGKEGNILSTTGSKELDKYTRIPGFEERVIARVLSVPDSVAHAAELGFRGKNLIAAQGPFSEEMDLAMIRQCKAKYVVTKESGSAGGFEEKLSAARRAGAKVVVIARPKDIGIPPEEAMKKLAERFKIPMPEAGKRRITIVGIGMGGETLTRAAAKAIASADLIAGAD